MSEEYYRARRNQICQLKQLIICEVGLKLFPPLVESVKWHSAAELHQIPLFNKKSSQLAEMETKKKSERKRERRGWRGIKESKGEMPKKHEMPWVIKSKTVKLSASPEKYCQVYLHWINPVLSVGFFLLEIWLPEVWETFPSLLDNTW